MSFKTLTEEFSKAEDKLTSPFDFENGVTILAVPEPMMPEIAQAAEKPEGTTLQLPNISNTKTVQVHQAPDLFKGELPHLPKEEHEAVIDWFDKASVDPQTPAEVRMYLLEIVMKLKSDAIKRIPDESPAVQEAKTEYKISVEVLQEDNWKPGLSFTQETPVSKAGIEKLCAKAVKSTEQLTKKPTMLRILQNDAIIHEGAL